MRIALLLSLVTAVTLNAQQATGVDIERVAPKKWRATYHLASPVTSLRFERPAGFFREHVWSVVTPGYTLRRDGTAQVAALDSGAAPRTDIVFEFPEYTNSLPKEYELFQPFTDGAVAIYTGHFHALASGATPPDTTRVRFMRMHTVPGTHVVVNGRVDKSPVVAFADTLANGTYVYIGTARPIETNDVVAIVDPGMPQWIRTMFDQRLPDLFHEYATRLDAQLPWKPVVLFGYDSVGSGYSSGGGSLTGLLNMVLTGSAWRTQSSTAAEQAFSLIAHESAHLWNGQLAHNNNGGAGAWMHEGAADALSTEMLRIFGIIDSVRYRARRNEMFNRCVAAVAIGSIETALSRGAIRQAYDCGFVMAMWTEAAARAQHSDASIFTFWRQLVSAGTAAGYDENTYFGVASRAGVPGDVIARMRGFLSATDSASIVVAGLSAAGLPVRLGEGAPPAAYQQEVARAAAVHLMQQACNRVSLNWGSPIRFSAVASCAPFATELLVSRIQNLRVKDEGAALFDAVRAACATGSGVTLQGDDGATLATVPCTRPLAVRSPWFSVGD